MILVLGTSTAGFDSRVKPCILESMIHNKRQACVKRGKANIYLPESGIFTTIFSKSAMILPDFKCTIKYNLVSGRVILFTAEKKGVRL